MRRSIAVLALSFGLVVGALPAVAEDPPEGPVHVALGDSQAFGSGTPRPDKLGYVAALNRWLTAVDCRDGTQSACPHLELANLSVPGATTSTLITGQLDEALELIEDRNDDGDPNNDVLYVTVTIGGNDVFRAFQTHCLGGVSPGCVGALIAALGQVHTNLNQTLGDLRAAAGPETRIVISTYDNPLGACILAQFESFADIVLEGGPGFPTGLNLVIETAATANGAEVADMFGQLTIEDWVGGDDCTHPDISGYNKMARIFLDVLD